jgi:hypothetical protein
MHKNNEILALNSVKKVGLFLLPDRVIISSEIEI